MSSGYYIPLPEEMEERLRSVSARTLKPQRILFENAIHRALDEQGWPHGDRGTIPIAVSYWYVNLFRHGQVKGHVGPFPDKDQALRAASSWRDGGLRARISRVPEGPPLTNAYQ